MYLSHASLPLPVIVATLARGAEEQKREGFWQRAIAREQAARRG